MTELILASSSPARKKLLQRLGLPFITLSPEIDESPLPEETAPQLVLRLAKEKAFAIATQHPSAIIIGADSVGLINNQILSKPLSHAHAVEQLKACSGNTMTFTTGLCVLDPGKERALTDVSTLNVHFKTLTTPMIEGYLKRDQPYQCAGSLKLEELGISLIDSIKGDDYTAIIGLPLMKLSTFLQKVGADPLE